MRMYQWLLAHTEWSLQQAGAVYLTGNIVIWFLAGGLLGGLFCAMTGSTDYQNVIGGAASVLALALGAVAGMYGLVRQPLSER